MVCGYLDGKRYLDKANYKPYLFLPSEEPTGFKTLDGKWARKKEFKTIWEAKQFAWDYQKVDNFTFYGMTQFAYPFIRDKFANCQYDHNLIKTVIMDIEVSTENGMPDLEKADKEITAITLMYKDITFAFGYGDFNPSDPVVKYFKCTDEEDLLKKFLTVWTSDLFRPDVVTGWNTNMFDIPYIINRIIQMFGETEAHRLSPWGVLTPRQYEFRGRLVNVFTIQGISSLDYFEMYRKFILTPRDSYSLNNIAFEELGERKTDYSEYESLNGLYKNNHQLFMEYNIRDCQLVQKLDNKLKLLELVYIFAYDSGVNFEDTLTAVRLWDVAIHNKLLDDHIVIPQRKETLRGRPVGAFVKIPEPKAHDWVVSFDLASLYPSLIMAYNISPDTFKGMVKISKSHDEKVDDWLVGMPENIDTYLKEHQLSMAANGAMFSKEKQGFLSVLMEELFEKRKVYKKKMIDAKKEYERTKDENLKNDIAKYHNLQMTAKVKLNSAYGALANEGFRFYDIRLAEAITLSGQLTIKFAMQEVNNYLNEYLGTKNFDYIITSDTDSLYVNMGPLVKTWGMADPKEIVARLDKFCAQEMQDMLDKTYTELSNRMHCHKQALFMKRESICEKGIFLSKKHYVLKVWDNEGVSYDPPELKMTGIEAVRSSTPISVRKAIKETFDIIMNGTEADVQKYIKEFRERFDELPFEEIAKSSTLNGLQKYSDTVRMYKSGCPMHVRGAIIYNKILKQAGLTGKFNPIFEKDKLKFCYLVMPNPTMQDVISVPAVLPKPLGLHKYLDRETQFNKTYLEPMKKVLEVVGWEHRKRNKMSQFMVKRN